MAAALDSPARPTQQSAPVEHPSGPNPNRFPALTHADRCDDLVSKELREATGNKHCGAQAFMRAVVTEETHLLFCAHHGRKQMPALTAQGIEVIDESAKINSKPTDAKASNGF